jgi:hypothetical protein
MQAIPDFSAGAMENWGAFPPFLPFFFLERPALLSSWLALPACGLPTTLLAWSINQAEFGAQL